MTEDVIRAKRIELVDDKGDPVVVLTAEGGDRAGLLVSSAEENAPIAMVGIDREGNTPFLFMNTGEGQASALLTFIEGQAFLHLANADGSEQTIGPPPMPVTEDYLGRVPGRDILAIFTADLTGEHPTFQSAEGTGFLVGKNVIVTCWHCVQATLPEGWAYVAIRPSYENSTEWFRMIAIEQDHNGTDLATAWVNAEPEMQLRIAEESALMSEDIWSYGYPLTDVSTHPELGHKRFRPNPRWMQTYILRIFDYDQHGFGSTYSYELDMPALAGMSGAPIVKAHSKEVVGVLYGRNDAEQIEEFGSKDLDTGERLTPEVVRMTYFAVAHHTENLKNLRGTATQGQPLADFLET